MRHTFTPIARGDIFSYDIGFWKWCIRCGVLKLGHQYFAPSLDQDKTIKATKFIACSPK